jgi:hypothetical protein
MKRLFLILIFLTPFVLLSCVGIQEKRMGGAVQHNQLTNTNDFHGLHSPGGQVANYSALMAVTNMWAGDLAYVQDSEQYWYYASTVPAPTPAYGTGQWVLQTAPGTITPSTPPITSTPTNTATPVNTSTPTPTPTAGPTPIFALTSNTGGNYPSNSSYFAPEFSLFSGVPFGNGSIYTEGAFNTTPLSAAFINPNGFLIGTGYNSWAGEANGNGYLKNPTGEIIIAGGIDVRFVTDWQDANYNILMLSDGEFTAANTITGQVFAIASNPGYSTPTPVIRSTKATTLYYPPSGTPTVTDIYWGGVLQSRNATPVQ